MLSDLKTDVLKVTTQWNLLEQNKQVEIDIEVLKKELIWAHLIETEGVMSIIFDTNLIDSGCEE